jgi:uncharacterized protein (DUF849 family)
MTYMRDLLPPDCTWFSFGISRGQIPMVAQAVLLGGNARVGFEDNIYLDAGVSRAEQRRTGWTRGSNHPASRKKQVASPAEARRQLGLR